MMFIANRLKRCREKMGLSLERLAVEIRIKTNHSVTRQTLENWEKGRNRPTVEGIVSICRFFDRPLGYFFDYKTNLPSEGKL
jgi:transcriptional regulator with XRE-family HTH domain